MNTTCDPKQSHYLYRRHKYGFYISTIQSPQYQVCGVMDDYGNLIDVSDDAFDNSLYFYTSQKS